jgi:hypothetical protein
MNDDGDMSAMEAPDMPDPEYDDPAIDGDIGMSPVNISILEF